MSNRLLYTDFRKISHVDAYTHMLKKLGNEEITATMSFNAVGKFAFKIKFTAQMLLGICVFIALFNNAGLGFWELISSTPNYEINLKYSLEVVSYGLGISAGIEMAYMLFTPGPIEAVEPLILGLASTLLYVLSQLNLDGSVSLLEYSILTASISLAIGGLFFIKDKYINSGSSDI